MEVLFGIFGLMLIGFILITGLGVLSAIFAGFTNGDKDSRNFAWGLVVLVIFVVFGIVTCSVI